MRRENDPFCATSKISTRVIYASPLLMNVTHESLVHLACEEDLRVNPPQTLVTIIVSPLCVDIALLHVFVRVVLILMAFCNEFLIILYHLL